MPARDQRQSLEEFNPERKGQRGQRKARSLNDSPSPPLLARSPRGCPSLWKKGSRAGELGPTPTAAIATYLQDLPGQTAPPPTAVSASDPKIAAGAAIYANEYSACHGMDGKGVPFLFPSLAESPNARSADPASLVRVLN